MPEVVVSSLGNLRQEIWAGGSTLTADEPRELGGEDIGPTPYELLLGALGACTSMTLLLYARRKGWPLEQVEVRLRHQRIHAESSSNRRIMLRRADSSLLSIQRTAFPKTPGVL